MKRNASALVLLAALGGCASMDPLSGAGCVGCGGGYAGRQAQAPGLQGPWGKPLAMNPAYSLSGEEVARATIAQGMSPGLMQAAAWSTPGSPSGIVLASGHGPHHGASMPPMMPHGVVAGMGAVSAPATSNQQARRTEVTFREPSGMKVSWLIQAADGRSGFSTNHVESPGRYNFTQGAIYRLKLSDIPGHTGVELYPTLEVVPSNARTESYLAHSAVPVNFTQEDLEQVITGGHYIVKVIYLPDPQYQDLASTGPDEVVSTRLEPGMDPLAEAQRRGNILLVVRLGNIDLELPNSPGMNTPSSHGARMMFPPVQGGQGPMSTVTENSGVEQSAYHPTAGAATPAQLAWQKKDKSQTDKQTAPKKWWWSESKEKK